ncbi:MAG: hypothetical protein KZQ81_10170, partial [Candidatus Thiodiazotropha sp. (ex Rostrolucina anterorostrata)]|nr:hypothetical protein [Candidatus Thiodiazotropha sp. (ex Rostrolucina anterorostrata)]
MIQQTRIATLFQYDLTRYWCGRPHPIEGRFGSVFTFSALADDTLRDQGEYLERIRHDSRSCREEIDSSLPVTGTLPKQNVDKKTLGPDEKIIFNCLSSIDLIHADGKKNKALLIDVR